MIREAAKVFMVDCRLGYVYFVRILRVNKGLTKDRRLDLMYPTPHTF
jgi:hypothetical protein